MRLLDQARFESYNAVAFAYHTLLNFTRAKVSAARGQSPSFERSTGNLIRYANR